jgi:hypothetical protein
VEQHDPLKPSVPHGSPCDPHAPRSAHVPLPPPGRSQKPLQQSPSALQGEPPAAHPEPGAHWQPATPAAHGWPAASLQIELQQSAPCVQNVPTAAQIGRGWQRPPLQMSEQQSEFAVHARP